MRSRTAAGALLPWVIALALASCADATHGEQVDALGPEPNGDRPGPTHRPGQPCVVCHGGQGPGSPQFSVAGTVYATQGQPGAASDVSVVIEDSLGATFTARTNGAGNFYVAVTEWAPVYPTQVTLSRGKTSQPMLTHIGRDGSCAGCHRDPASTTSPGAVYLNAAPFPADGAP